MVRRTGIAKRFIREHVPHVRLVRVGFQQVHAADASLIGLVEEFAVVVKVKTVAFVREVAARGRLAVQAEAVVVVELVQVHDRATSSGKRISRGRVLNEQMKEGQIIRLRHVHDRAEVLREAKGVHKLGPARRKVVRVGGDEVIANHLAGDRRARGNRGAVKAVAGGAIAMESIVIHRHGDFRPEHDAIVQGQSVNGPKSWRQPGGHEQILIVGWDVGGVDDVQDQGAEVGVAGAVRAAGCRHRKITPDGRVHR